jgi:hypothetical protein
MHISSTQVTNISGVTVIHWIDFELLYISFRTKSEIWNHQS